MNTSADHIAAVWRVPFSGGAANVVHVKAGASIAGILDCVQGLPSGFADGGTICINGEVVPPALWRSVRPKPMAGGKPVIVTLHMPLHGGGGGGGGGRGGGKQIFALVATIALAAVTFGISTFGIPGLLAAGSFGAKLLATTVAIAGTLAISALTAPPTRKASAPLGDTQDRGPASASGNVLQPSAFIPRVVGTRKIFPPLGSQPLVDLVGDDEYVEAIYALAGEHEITDIRIGDGSIDSSEDVQYQVREGWPDDAPTDLFERYGISQTPQSEISPHDVSDAAQDTLSDQSSPDNSLPVWHSFASRNSPDEIWLHVGFPEGIADRNSISTRQRIPLRVRFRLKGASTWINCPELHVASSEATAVRKAIKFVWTPRGEVSIPTNGFVAAYKATPNSGVAPFTGAWTADSYFSSGSGDDGLHVFSVSSSKVANVSLEYNQAVFHLDEGTHPKGIYEVEVKRGCCIVDASFAPLTYVYGSNVYDLFGYYSSSGVYKIPRSRADLQEKTYIARVASVWNEHPVQRAGTALIAVRAKNRSIDQLSCVASGYVPDWDGTDWRDWVTTSNPAPHMVDAMRWRHSVYQLPANLLDSTGLVAWRTRCATAGYECNAIFEGSSFSDGARIIGSCGYARPFASDTYGVIEDYDRSAETPTQVFTPRNTADFSIDKAFPRLPDGFRVRYTDETSDYVETEEIVFRDGIANGSNLEQVTYEGITNRQAAIDRASFDLAQARARSAFYSFRAPAEFVVSRRGDIVGLAYDEFGRMFGQARIVHVERNSSGQVTGVFLDASLDVYDEIFMQDVPVMQDVAFVQMIGVSTDVVIRRSNMSVTAAHSIVVTESSTSYIQFSSPFTDDEINPGNLCVVGNTNEVYKRAIITSITPGVDLTAQITCVDEAPEIHA